MSYGSYRDNDVEFDEHGFVIETGYTKMYYDSIESQDDEDYGKKSSDRTTFRRPVKRNSRIVECDNGKCSFLLVEAVNQPSYSKDNQDKTHAPIIVDVDKKHKVEGRRWWSVIMTSENYAREVNTPALRTFGTPLTYSERTIEWDLVPHFSSDNGSIRIDEYLYGGTDLYKYCCKYHNVTGDVFDYRMSNRIPMEEYVGHSKFWDHVWSRSACRKQRNRVPYVLSNGEDLESKALEEWHDIGVVCDIPKEVERSIGEQTYEIRLLIEESKRRLLEAASHVPGSFEDYADLMQKNLKDHLDALFTEIDEGLPGFVDKEPLYDAVEHMVDLVMKKVDQYQSVRIKSDRIVLTRQQKLALSFCANFVGQSWERRAYGSLKTKERNLVKNHAVLRDAVVRINLSSLAPKEYSVAVAYTDGPTESGVLIDSAPFKPVALFGEVAGNIEGSFDIVLDLLLDEEDIAWLMKYGKRVREIETVTGATVRVEEGQTVKDAVKSGGVLTAEKRITFKTNVNELTVVGRRSIDKELWDVMNQVFDGWMKREHLTNSIVTSKNLIDSMKAIREDEYPVASISLSKYREETIGGCNENEVTIISSHLGEGRLDTSFSTTSSHGERLTAFIHGGMLNMFAVAFPPTSCVIMRKAFTDNKKTVVTYFEKPETCKTVFTTYQKVKK